MAMWKVLSSAENINLVRTQIEHHSLCRYPGYYWWRPFKVYKGHIEISSSFWVHNRLHCPRIHPVQVLRDVQRSVYICTNSRTAIHLGKKLLNKVTHPKISDMLWFYFDENNFDQDQKINRRNPSDVPHVTHTKSPEIVMVLGVVSNEGHVMPPYFMISPTPTGFRLFPLHLNILS